MEGCVQLNLMDMLESFMDEQKHEVFSNEKKPKKVHSMEKETLQDILSDKDNYLKKGEVVETLAKEEFAKFIRTFSLSEMEEKLFSLNFEKCKEHAQVAKKIASKVFRPVLAEFLENPEDTLSSIQKLLPDLFFINIEKAEADLPFKAFEIGKGDINNNLLKLEVSQKNGRKLVVYGLDKSVHRSKFHNAILKCGYTVCDLAVLLAYLCMIGYVNNDWHTKGVSYEYAINGWQNLKEQMAKETENEFYFDHIFHASEHILIAYEKMQEEYPQINWKFTDVKKTTAIQNYKMFHALLAYYPELVREERIELSYLEYLTRCKKLKDEKYWGLPIGYLDDYFEMITESFKRLLGVKSDQVRLVKEFKALHSSVAKSFQTKKNIPKKTIEAMEKSHFNQYFSYVEFDEDVDIEKVAEIEKEFISFKETYIKDLDLTGNAIRFRKLGKQKALGLYYPGYKCLCVDIHSPQSLIHELGHLIDYCNGRLSNRNNNLFNHLYNMYEKRLLEKVESDNVLAEKWNGKTKYNKDYFLKPEEVFAYNFEIYVSKVLGVKNSIVEQDFSAFQYPCDEPYLEIVKAFFDTIFN